MRPHDGGSGNGFACVPCTARAFVFIHAPIASRRSTLGAGISPSPVGPTFSRKLPPFDAMSTSLRTRSASDFQLPSFFL